MSVLSPNFKVNLTTSNDLEGNARDSASPEIERMPAVKKPPMPVMSDQEVYLRINVPDGLETDGSWSQHYGLPQKNVADWKESPIKSDSDQ